MSAVSSSSSSALQLSGLASGIDWTSIISEMLTIAKAPETQMTAEQTTDNEKDSAYQTIASDLTTLGNDVTTLSNPSFFGSRTASVADPSIASATAAQGTPLGNFAFDVTQLASGSAQVGTAVAAKPLSATNNVANLVIGSAGFATPITAGTFTVNGQAITVSTTETLQSVFDQISTATNGAVTATYNATTDEISLASNSPIVLGSATDTSNFLQSAELYGNGTGAVTSTSALGGINLNSTLSSANLATPISDGGAGAGEFLINGVQINFNASTSTINDVLQEINNSSAGVTASYDGANNSFVLTNNSTGDLGISLQDVTGNFLAATGLSGGALQLGNNLEYSIDGGGAQVSESNTIDASSAGLPGLSVTAQGVGSTTVAVGSDTSTIATAIQSFVTDYNAVQTYISSQTSTSTNSSGDVTPGLLTGDMDSENIETTLRQMVGASPSGSSGGVQSLNDLGIESDGTDNLLTVSNTTTLTNAIANNLNDVQNLFTNSTNGIATSLSTYLTGVTGLDGILDNDETNMTTDSASLTASINSLNAQISSEQTELTSEFTTMETAINTINTQKQYLNAYFGDSSGSSNAAPAAAGTSFGT
ncbi:MAG TPA: flagellar filament capping protein FliD [Candidatus Baltobacteraceae bacterium]|jgi:flagellar hook-associated protein 2|nr:flagellar filament capping protein FliD [Candidatus Baltobacteraceae bacterium]